MLFVICRSLLGIFCGFLYEDFVPLSLPAFDLNKLPPVPALGDLVETGGRIPRCSGPEMNGM